MFNNLVLSILLISCNLFCIQSSKCDPLVLTPFIHLNRLHEARRLSHVLGFHGFQDIKSYSGFLTVDKKYDSNLFFWFFPSMVNL